MTGRPERVGVPWARRLVGLAVVVGALLLRPHAAPGAATEPGPILSAASGAVAGTVRTAVVDGVFDFPNSIESGTALHLVVFQGTRFVRYPLGGGTPVSGDSGLLADGTLAQPEVATFLGAGAPAPSAVRFLTMTPDQVRVMLPATFTAGPATAVVFGIFGIDTVFSNPLTFVLP
jgi:hypothetical protein